MPNPLVSQRPLVAVILLNWNGFSDTAACIDSLQTLNYKHCRIFVVDNASHGNDVELLRKRFGKSIDILVNPTNEGFAQGNNLGIAYAKRLCAPDYYWLLNNDTVVEQNTLSYLVDHALAHPRDGIIGSYIRYFQQDKIYCLGGGSLSFWTGIDRLYGARQPTHRAFSPPFFSYISGCSMFIAARVIADVHGFDPEYFLYSEEADLCVRSKQKGHTLCYEPRAVVDHKVAQSSGYHSRTYVYYFLRNKLLFMKKHAPPSHWPIYILVFLCYYCVGFLALSLYRRQNPHIGIMWRAISDFFMNRFGRQAI